MNKMYNEKIKNQYLQNLQSQREINNNNILNTLIRMSNVEKEYGVDIFDASIEELSFMLSEIMNVSIVTKTVLFCEIRRYINWAILNGKSQNNTENLLDLISPQEINTEKLYEIKFFKDYNSLISFCDIVFEDYNEERVDLPFLCVVLLLYNRIELRDIFNIKKDNYNEREGIITINNKIYKLYDETNQVIKAMLHCEFLCLKSDALKPLRKNEFLINTTAKIREEKKFIQAVNFNLFEKINFYKASVKKIKKISPTTIYKSGVFFEIYNNNLNNKEDIIKKIKEYYSYKQEIQYVYIYQEYIDWHKYYYL